MAKKIYVVGGYQEQSGVWGCWDTYKEAKEQAKLLAPETGGSAIYTLEMSRKYTPKEIFDGAIKDEEIEED